MVEDVVHEIRLTYVAIQHHCFKILPYNTHIQLEQKVTEVENGKKDLVNPFKKGKVKNETSPMPESAQSRPVTKVGKVCNRKWTKGE